VRLVFWWSAAMIVYVYAGYPLLLALWARLVGRRRAVRAGISAPPGVSIVIAARNEAARLPARIDNLLALDYPAALRQIIVVSDGSTDDTMSALAPYRNRIDIVMLPPGGKAAALNSGVALARHEILVFADARQTFAPGALRALTAPFADETIGGVSGELVLGCESTGGRRFGTDRREHERLDAADRRGHLGSAIAEGVGLYWRYEKTLRRLESAVGSTLGATGAIYAMRRSLWCPLPEEALLDDVLAPMRVVLAGRRVIFDDQATAFDYTSPDSSAETRRKIRTLAGNVQILWLEPRLLVPIVNPVWLQYCSHKVGRLIVPYALLALLVASIALVQQHLFFAMALAAQLVLYLLAGYGAWIEQRTVDA